MYIYSFRCTRTLYIGGHLLKIIRKTLKLPSALWIQTPWVPVTIYQHWSISSEFAVLPFFFHSTIQLSFYIYTSIFITYCSYLSSLHLVKQHFHFNLLHACIYIYMSGYPPLYGTRGMAWHVVMHAWITGRTPGVRNNPESQMSIIINIGAWESWMNILLFSSPKRNVWIKSIWPKISANSDMYTSVLL